MTNAEAIEILRVNYPDACFEQLSEAVDKAIEALMVRETHEKRTETHACDCISRQAAIDALGNEPELWEDPYSLSEDYSKGQREQWNNDREALLNLASAKWKGKWIKEYEKWFTDYPYKCTNCGKYSRARYHFCPNCGADMGEGREE